MSELEHGRYSASYAPPPTHQGTGMAPFSIHATGIHGIKDKIESMTVQGNVYSECLGTSH